MSKLQSRQQRAIASLHALVPEAKVSRRYSVLLNGFAVSLPYAKLPKLLAASFAKPRVPELHVHAVDEQGPAVIGAPQFAAATGAKGEGVRVAVVDDGVDQEHPYLSSAGFEYPAGFPKGTAGGTTPKVIVARGFAGPGASSAPLDRELSFHGTFVAGVIAGAEGTNAPAGVRGFCSEENGGCHPAVSGLSGVAPRAQIGNYRVFNVPLPLGGCCSGSTPEIVKAFEAAVADGMHVINFSGGSAQADPRTDAMMETVANVVRAGVVPVISAGNDRDFFGLGTAGSPATAPDAISVGATANSHVFDASLTVVSPQVSFGRIPFVPAGTIPPSWITNNQRLVDVGVFPGVSRLLCGDGAALPPNSLARRDRARQPRRLPVRREVRARPAGGRRGHGRGREPPRRPGVRALLRHAAARSRTSTATGSGQRWQDRADRCRCASRATCSRSTRPGPASPRASPRAA